MTIHHHICNQKCIALMAIFICTYNIFETKATCTYEHSINITNGVFDSNTKSYRYGNQTFHPGQYNTFDYKMNETVRIPTSSHVRGCICQVRPCFSKCCPLGEVYEHGFGCKKIDESTNQDEMMLDVLDPNKKTTSNENILNTFNFVIKHTNCTDYYKLEPENNLFEQFSLLKVNHFRIIY